MQAGQKSPDPLSFSNDIYEARCFAPIPEDLALSRLEIDEHGRPRNEIFAGKILSMIRQRSGVEKLYAPNTARASARIVSPKRFIHKVRLGTYLTIRNNPDLFCEGTSIQPNEGVVFNTKGCPILVFTGGGYCFVVHAGRDSLIDRHRILTRRKSRYHEGVIHAAIALFQKLQVPPTALRLEGFFGLNPQSFDHRFDDPVYGDMNRMIANEYNRDGKEVIKTYADGNQKLVLGKLIELQSEELGIPRTNISYTHRLPVQKNFAAHSTSPTSNLVLIVRK